MTYLVITRGIPASGKTTWAKEWIAVGETGGEERVRVNRDEIRFALHGRYWPADEPAVTAAQHAAVRAFLKKGTSVVVDDTNLRMSAVRAWQAMAQSCGADLVVADSFVQVDVEECVRRDRARANQGGRAVGEEVIRDFYRRYVAGGLSELQASPEDAVWAYVPNLGLSEAWIVDVDGTLAHMTDRGPYDFDRVSTDRLDIPVARVVQALARSAFIIVMSGRDDSCEEDTRAWLDRHNIPYDGLVMRAEGDSRKDAVVKLELFRERVAPHYNVVGSIDDRDQVVAMWRSVGLKCLQAQPGDF